MSDQSFQQDRLEELLFASANESFSVEERDELNAILRDNADARRFAAQFLSLDAALAESLGTGEAAQRFTAQEVSKPGKRLRFPTRWMAAAASVAAVIAVIFLFQAFHGDTANAAKAELDRLIQVTQADRDRSYRITKLDGHIRNPSRPPIDGAILHTVGAGQYVLIRTYADGAEFITGSDGKTSWSCPPAKGGKTGIVRVSNDLSRFRGPVPGQQSDIPFIDIRSDLGHLRDAYDLKLLPAKDSPTGGEKWNGILAERREQVPGRTQRVEIWYVPVTGVIQQMHFVGMPGIEGAPANLLVELIEQRDLGPNFFDHTAHHGPERRVISSDE